MAEPIKKAMVLTAGLGTRLNPITQKLPKPLVSVLNIPNIIHVLFSLKRAGIEEVVMNLFHLPETMEDFFKLRSPFNLSLEFTRENPILGTGGGVKNAEQYLKGAPFVLANCDFVSDINILNHIENHLEKKALASMLLIQDPSRAHLYSEVGVDSSSNLVSLPKLKTHQAVRSGIFTGIHILNSEVLDLLESKPCGINDVLYPKLMQQFPDRVFGFVDSNCFWLDTGDVPAFYFTSRRLLELLSTHSSYLEDLFQELEVPLEEILPQVWIEKGEKLPKNVTIRGPVIIGKGTLFTGDCNVGPYSIIGDNCLIEGQTSIESSVLLSNSKLSFGTRLSQSLLFENSILKASDSA